MNDFKKSFFAQLEQGRLLKQVDIPSKYQDWYQYFTNLTYFRNFLNNDFEELIFHDSESLQIINQGQTKLSKIKGLENWFHQLLFWSLKVNQSWNHNKPQVSFDDYLEEQHLRVTLVAPNCFADKVAKVFIRKAQKSVLPLTKFTATNSQQSTLENLFQQRSNTIICGETGCGKTTFLNSLMNKMNTSQHLISIEDVCEIKKLSICHSQLIANSSEQMKDFCEYALRMNPYRLVLGEVRSHEVVPLILAMNTGHRGFMSTLHANSAVDAIHRLATLFQLYQPNSLSLEFVLQLLCQGIDHVIFMKDKQVQSVIKILGHENGRVLYQSEAAFVHKAAFCA